jgi:hypothetical protein
MRGQREKNPAVETNMIFPPFPVWVIELSAVEERPIVARLADLASDHTLLQQFMAHLQVLLACTLGLFASVFGASSSGPHPT